jgi:hypothetical protein
MAVSVCLTFACPVLAGASEFWAIDGSLPRINAGKSVREQNALQHKFIAFIRLCFNFYFIASLDRILCCFKITGDLFVKPYFNHRFCRTRKKMDPGFQICKG